MNVLLHSTKILYDLYDKFDSPRYLTIAVPGSSKAGSSNLKEVGVCMCISFRSVYCPKIMIRF